MEKSGNGSDDQALTPGQRWRFTEFRRRLEYVGESYRYWKNVEKDRPTVNESLILLNRALHVPSRKRRDQIRLHPMIEIGISMFVLRSRPDRSDISRPSQAEIQEASVELLRRTKPLRGRPRDETLWYHVKGLILLCEWASGVPVTASPTTNSVYDPQMTSDGAKSIEIAFRRIDPSVTKTTLMNIIRRTRAKRELEGKRFEDFFPLYKPEPHPDLGPPVQPTIDFNIAYPIYCS